MSELQKIEHPHACTYGAEYRGGDKDFPPITEEQLNAGVLKYGDVFRSHPNRFREILGDRRIALWRFDNMVPLNDIEFQGLRRRAREAAIPSPNPNEFTKEQEEMAPFVVDFLVACIATIDHLKQPKPEVLALAGTIVFQFRHAIDKDKQEDLTKAIASAFS